MQPVMKILRERRQERLLIPLKEIYNYYEFKRLEITGTYYVHSKEDVSVILPQIKNDYYLGYVIAFNKDNNSLNCTRPKLKNHRCWIIQWDILRQDKFLGLTYNKEQRCGEGSIELTQIRNGYCYFRNGYLDIDEYDDEDKYILKHNSTLNKDKLKEVDNANT